MSYLALTTGKRKIKDGSRFNHYFPTEKQSYGNSLVLNPSGDVYQTVKYMAQIIKNDAPDTAQIAQFLKAPTRSQTIANIHKFMIDYLQYDTEAQEKLRSPRRTWWVGSTQNDKETSDTGVDCDDLAIFSGSILYNLNIPFFIRIVKITGNEYQHVYLVVPNTGNELTGTYTILDGVLSKYNYEHPYTKQKTYNMAGTQISYLGEVGTLGNLSDDPILNMLLQQRQQLQASTPNKINKDEALQLLNHVIDNWNDAQDRVIALEKVAALEKAHLPNMRYLQTLSYFVQNGSMPRNNNKTIQGVGEILHNPDPCSPDYYPFDYEDPDWYNNPDTWQPPAYCNNSGGGSNNGGGGSSFDWNELLNSLASFDWGILFGNNNSGSGTTPTTPTTPATTNAGFQIAGMSIGTIAGIGLAGVLAYMLYANLQGSKTGKNPMIQQHKKVA